VFATHRFFRQTRNGTQAHLIEANEGQFYLTRLSTNPQHRRVLNTEAIGSVLLHALGVSTPEPVLVSVTAVFLEESPNVSLQLPLGRTAVRPGQHYGSPYAGHPQRQTVFDLVPVVRLSSIQNRAHFLGTLVFDQWVANTYRRQAVFLQQQRDLRASTASRRIPLRAIMVEQGHIFNWPFRNFSAGPLHGLHPSPHLYDGAHLPLDFNPSLDKAASFPPALIEHARNRIPGEWVHPDEHGLDCPLEVLIWHDGPMPELIRDCLLARPRRFSIGVVEIAGSATTTGDGIPMQTQGQEATGNGTTGSCWAFRLIFKAATLTNSIYSLGSADALSVAPSTFIGLRFSQTSRSTGTYWMFETRCEGTARANTGSSTIAPNASDGMDLFVYRFRSGTVVFSLTDVTTSTTSTYTTSNVRTALLAPCLAVSDLGAAAAIGLDVKLSANVYGGLVR
jgi:hypothetical protein